MFPPRPPRAGVQIHAVPDSERATDPSGRKLPWGYDYSTAPPPTTSTTSSKPRDPPLERGPFGRSMRRSRSGLSRSRSKTAEPRREEDRQRAENLVFEDNVFGALKKVGGSGGKEEGEGAGDEGGVKSVGAVQTASAEEGGEPTEVFLYGFGADTQWAAIDFYERVSSGTILEDYPRTSSGAPHTARRIVGSLSRAAMRKKNKFAGGEHWIKVTFSSREGAELAVARSPHTIKGYLVYCEPWTGRGPQRDEAVVATMAGAQITSDVLPVSFSTEDPFARRVEGEDGSPQSSNTASSATARMEGSEMQQVGGSRPPWGGSWGGGNVVRNTQDSPATSTTLAQSSSTTSALDRQSRAPVQRLTTAAPSSSTLNAPTTPRRSRIEGATRATVLPMEMALAPKAPKASWSSWLGAGEVLGSVVPRMEDGVTFDWEAAGWYWRVVWLCDRWLGTEFLGGVGGD
ncbi:uncharacterized protein MYCGRDRAFT_109336 [Zymoseptoria tritici IPO323]|uniref:Uncharacterized protein n=1 Tax=Zymoseptoria tritici (strain CBS 115943 / IPO323) TaxID=336722 RepID=F9XAK5_ZYMTI|nr:uncharacterized protein MYCGRDRAFT_109336 [Zymoseptoria tritici IPO323]EGP87011.1 hypothetical protein MYCGRDRAFT_109336 [Zymoseptoria tritici IPO323]